MNEWVIDLRSRIIGLLADYEFSLIIALGDDVTKQTEPPCKQTNFLYRLDPQPPLVYATAGECGVVWCGVVRCVACVVACLVACVWCAGFEASITAMVLRARS